MMNFNVLYFHERTEVLFVVQKVSTKGNGFIGRAADFFPNSKIVHVNGDTPAPGSSECKHVISVLYPVLYVPPTSRPRPCNLPNQ